MDISCAIEYVTALAEGIDPVTGEALPKEHICNRVDTVRALYTILQAAEKAEAPVKKKNLPDNAGSPWTTEEERKLLDRYNAGMTAAEIAKEHQRTRSAIAARLVELGVVSDRSAVK